MKERIAPVQLDQIEGIKQRAAVMAPVADVIELAKDAGYLWPEACRR
jgi:hypothetical protein